MELSDVVVWARTNAPAGPQGDSLMAKRKKKAKKATKKAAKKGRKKA
jgi:hypothetical protein